MLFRDYAVGDLAQVHHLFISINFYFLRFLCAVVFICCQFLTAFLLRRNLENPVCAPFSYF